MHFLFCSCSQGATALNEQDIMEAVMQEELLILGVGNPLLGDDGAGIRAVELLQQQNLPPHVQVLEIGTPGWGLGAWLEGRSYVIMIDAVDMGLPPGHWRQISLEEVQLLMEESSFSLHQPDLASGLALAQELNILPEVIIMYGIQPADLTPGNSLSPAVQNGLLELVETIVYHVKRGYL
jgi:hydrogenase maturation protease